MLAYLLAFIRFLILFLHIVVNMLTIARSLTCIPSQRCSGKNNKYITKRPNAEDCTCIVLVHRVLNSDF